MKNVKGIISKRGMNIQCSALNANTYFDLLSCLPSYNIDALMNITNIGFSIVSKIKLHISDVIKHYIKHD